MTFTLTQTNDQVLAEVADGTVIRTTQEALDAIANAGYQGATHMLLREDQLDPDFFDLKTGFAGEVLQKFINYDMRLVVVGNFDGYESESLQAFISECNRGTQAAFVPDRQSALERIAKT